jgi:hypothetical protein
MVMLEDLYYIDVTDWSSLSSLRTQPQNGIFKGKKDKLKKYIRIIPNN